MKTFRRIVFWLITSVILLGVLLLVCVNLYVQSEGVTGKIKVALSKKMGMPVTFEDISYSPWRGIFLGDMTILNPPSDETQEARPFFHAPRFSAQVSLPSILKDTIQVTRITCEEPTLSFFQTKNGKLIWPRQIRVAPKPATAIPPQAAATPPGEPAPPVATPTPPKPKSAPTTTVPPKTDPTVARTQPAQPTEAQPIEVQPSPAKPKAPALADKPKKTLKVADKIKNRRVAFNDFVLKNGAIEIISAEHGHRLIRLEGIRTELDLQKLDKIQKGSLKIKSASLLDTLHITDITSEIHLKDTTILLPEIRGDADGGTFEGSMSIAYLPGLPFRAAARLANIEVAKIAARNKYGLEIASGKLQGEFVAQGPAELPQNWQGAGRFEMVDGKVGKNPILERLGRQMNIREMVDLSFEEADVAFSLTEGRLRVDELRVETDNMRLASRGFISFGGELSLAARLYFSERIKGILQQIERQFPEKMLMQFEKIEGVDGYFRQFLISGSISDPRTDFWEPGVGSRIEETVGELEETIFQSHMRTPRQEIAIPELDN